MIFKLGAIIDKKTIKDSALDYHKDIDFERDLKK